MFSVFQTYMRGFHMYLDAGVAVVNTSPTFAGFFGDASQNQLNVVNTPQVFHLSGCILYGNKQPWEFIEPGSRGNYQQNKIRESEGVVRLKVDPTGYALLKDAEQIIIDKFTFVIDSTPRPHGLIGDPNMYTFTLLKVDPS